MYVLVAILWVLCGFTTAWIASIKRDSVPAGFFVGFLLGPLGVLVAALVPAKGKTCPFCRERIDKAAIVCPRCQRDQGASAAGRGSQLSAHEKGAAASVELSEACSGQRETTGALFVGLVLVGIVVAGVWSNRSTKSTPADADRAVSSVDATKLSPAATAFLGWSKLKPGMTKEEVHQALGSPASSQASAADATESWLYAEGTWHATVLFQAGRVKRWSDPWTGAIAPLQADAERPGLANQAPGQQADHKLGAQHEEEAHQAGYQSYADMQSARAREADEQAEKERAEQERIAAENEAAARKAGYSNYWQLQEARRAAERAANAQSRHAHEGPDGFVHCDLGYHLSADKSGCVE